MPIVATLTGHVSHETAFVVDDYPYGFKLRCKIRYWLETSKHGTRFVSQTSNPKVSGLVWNAPKRSTYAAVAGMGLDEKGHVTWTSIEPSSKPETVASFLRLFPHMAIDVNVRAIVVAQLRYAKSKVEGRAVWRINGVEQPWTESQIEDARKDFAAWEAVRVQILSAHGESSLAIADETPDPLAVAG